jgi:hypothetical protein
VEEFFDELFRGNVAEVKVVLASVVAALAIYQVALMAVGYGKVRVRSLAPPVASRAHRAVGDTIVVVTAVVALACLSYYGYGEDDGGVHAVLGTFLLVVLSLKIAVVRWWHRLGRFLPLLGLSVFTLFMLTWATSAGSFLFGG